jgi:hypothetical protein
LPSREVAPEQWKRLGFNNSSVHTDIVSMADRTRVAAGLSVALASTP